MQTERLSPDLEVPLKPIYCALIVEPKPGEVDQGRQALAKFKEARERALPALRILAEADAVWQEGLALLPPGREEPTFQDVDFRLLCSFPDLLRYEIPTFLQLKPGDLDEGSDDFQDVIGAGDLFGNGERMSDAGWWDRIASALDNPRAHMEEELQAALVGKAGVIPADVAAQLLATKKIGADDLMRYYAATAAASLRSGQYGLATAALSGAMRHAGVGDESSILAGFYFIAATRTALVRLGKPDSRINSPKHRERIGVELDDLARKAEADDFALQMLVNGMEAAVALAGQVHA